ncbi:MAG: hypothetical protein ACWGO1_00270 [Anaerolineales bacterium]
MRTEEFVGMVESLNERLRATGAGGAESAFGLGCGIGLLPVVGITLLLWIFGVVNLILGMMMLVVGLLALAGISILLANLARSNTVKRVYRTEVEPEIVRYLSRQRLSRQDFDTAAYQLLPVDAPLQGFLHPVMPAASGGSEE